MKTLGIGAIALVIAGIAGFFLFSSQAPKETPQLRLEAVLSPSGTDVSDRVDWRVKWNGSGLGPQIATVSEAMPGDFEAELDVLGGEEAVGTLTLAEGEGGVLRVDVNAALVEVALPETNTPQRVGFRFETATGGGSAGVFVSEDKTARALVSPQVSKLELETDSGAFRINGALTPGTVARFVFDGAEVRPSE